MEATSDDDMQNNQSDQEENNSVTVHSDNEEDQSYTENHVIQSPDFLEQQSNANSESEHESDANSHKKQNEETSDNEVEEEKGNCEIESCDEGNSDDEQNAVQSEGEQEVSSDREVEQETPGSPLPSDIEAEHSDNQVQHSDDEVQHSDNEVQHSDNEVQHSDNEVQHSDNEVQHSDNEVQHSDNEVQHSDNEVQHSDNEVQHSDSEARHSDSEARHSDSEARHSDNEVQHSDNEAQHSDDEIQHSDDEIQHSDNEIQHSDNEVQHSDIEVQHSDNEIQNSDNEIQHSDEEAQHSDDDMLHSDVEIQQSDIEIQQSDEDVHHSDNDDNAEIHHSNEEHEEHSDHSDEVHRSDEEVHHSDDEQSFPPSPVESVEGKVEASDDENEKSNISGNILTLTDNEDSDVDSDSGNESKVGELIADIFGESDEDEEFEGFGEEDLAAAKEKKEKKRATVLSDSDEEEEEGNLTIVEEPKVEAEALEERNIADNTEVLPAISDEEDSDVETNRRMPSDFVYDFELMMQKKKENQRRRKRKDVDLINDSDDLIAEIILQMKQVAEEDRQLNKNKSAATKKLKLLPLVTSQLKKHDLKEAFLDQGILSVITDWLSPLPDRSLPHLQVRDSMFRLLQEFPPIDQGLLKSSNIGRAVMYLYKHPKETKENRDRAGKLINEWARPIFNLNTNFHSMSKEEREQRDFEHMPKKRKLRLETGETTTTVKQDIDKALSGEDKALRPGEKGWIARARVPTPSMRDYVVRPKWNTEAEFSRGSSRRAATRLDKHLRNMKEKKKLMKAQRAVSISIEGRKMAL